MILHLIHYPNQIKRTLRSYITLKMSSQFTHTMTITLRPSVSLAAQQCLSYLLNIIIPCRRKNNKKIFFFKNDLLFTFQTSLYTLKSPYIMGIEYNGGLNTMKILIHPFNYIHQLISFILIIFIYHFMNFNHIDLILLTELYIPMTYNLPQVGFNFLKRFEFLITNKK